MTTCQVNLVTGHGYSNNTNVGHLKTFRTRVALDKCCNSRMPRFLSFLSGATLSESIPQILFDFRGFYFCATVLLIIRFDS